MKFTAFLPSSEIHCFTILLVRCLMLAFLNWRYLQTLGSSSTFEVHRVSRCVRLG
uniref:Uncharacterized protein n=1 Tax=Anguilla anguilla TaxID=7936 RepID=A0A0E9VXT4_ANGAN